MMLVMKMLCLLYPLEVYNFELRFSQNLIKHVFLFHFLHPRNFKNLFLKFLVAPCRITLSPFFQTRSERHILAAIVLLEHVPLKVYFCFLNLCILK